ncbi:MAG: type II secretion system protein GspN [Deltaproteobacteria bacterium]|nr:type II secretion system protein GspN [Deltaproteobacteria bacterium]
MRIRTLLIKGLKYFSVSTFGSIIFFLSFWMFMDWSLIKDRIEKELGKATGFTVKIGDFSLGFGSVSLTDIVMTGDSDKEGEKPTKFKISTLNLKSSLLSLARGEENLSFYMDAMGGSVEGSYYNSENKKKFSLEIKDIKVSAIPLMKNFMSLPIVGRITGKGEMTIPGKGFRKADGKLEIACNKCIIGDGKTKVKATFLAPPKNKGSQKWAQEGVTLPPMNLGKFGGNIDIKNGVAGFNDFVAKSSDGEAELAGNIKLRDPLKTSISDLYFKFKFSDEAKKKNESLEAIEFSMARQGKRPDGFYGLAITGAISKIKFKQRRRGIVDNKKKHANGGKLKKPHRPRDRTPRNPRKPGLNKKFGGKIKPGLSRKIMAPKFNRAGKMPGAAPAKKD